MTALASGAYVGMYVYLIYVYVVYVGVGVYNVQSMCLQVCTFVSRSSRAASLAALASGVYVCLYVYVCMYL